MSSQTPKPSHFEERMDLLIKDMASKRRNTNWSSNLTLVIGLIVIIALCVYYGYGYRILDENTQPDVLADAAHMKMIEYTDTAKQTAAEEIKKSAPTWAEQASQQLISNMPSMRERLELSIADYLESQLEESKTMTRGEFAKIMKDNREEFKEAIDIMIQKGKSTEFVDKIMPIIEQNYAKDMRSSVENALGSLREINERLDKLTSGEKLNPIEEQQKHILGLVRVLRDTNATN